MKLITPPPKEELEALLQKNSLKIIGKMMGVSHRTVWKWGRDYNLPMRSRGGITGHNKRPDVTDEMLISDLDEGLNLTQISDRRGISRPAVARRLLKIEARFPNKNYRISKTLDWEQIEREYREGSTEEKLANKYNTGIATIQRGLRKQGTQIRHRTAHMKGWHAERKAKLAEADATKQLVLELRAKQEVLEAKAAQAETLPKISKNPLKAFVVDLLGSASRYMSNEEIAEQSRKEGFRCPYAPTWEVLLDNGVSSNDSYTKFIFRCRTAAGTPGRIRKSQTPPQSLA